VNKLRLLVFAKQRSSKEEYKLCFSARIFDSRVKLRFASKKSFFFFTFSRFCNFFAFSQLLHIFATQRGSKKAARKEAKKKEEHCSSIKNWSFFTENKKYFLLYFLLIIKKL
jgi:hypothetical protein